MDAFLDGRMDGWLVGWLIFLVGSMDGCVVGWMHEHGRFRNVRLPSALLERKIMIAHNTHGQAGHSVPTRFEHFLVDLLQHDAQGGCYCSQ